MSEDVFNLMNDSFEDMDGRLHILEQNIPIEQQFEYFRTSENIRRSMRNIRQEDLNRFEEDLQSLTLSKAKKKKILSTLALSKEVRAYRMLEEYVKKPEEGLANWAQMALIESRMLIESDLSGERHVYISTGLGGKDGKLRYYVLLLSDKGQAFLPYQKDIMKKEFEYFSSKGDTNIEKIHIGNGFVEIYMLSPINNNLKFLLEHVVNECNNFGSFISPIITVTNVKALSRAEINMVIRHLRNTVAARLK